MTLKELLGHRDLETTTRYTHVTSKARQTPSPLDTLPDVQLPIKVCYRRNAETKFANISGAQTGVSFINPGKVFMFGFITIGSRTKP